MDGLVAGQLYARNSIARQLAREGQADEAQKERERPVTVNRALQTVVVRSAMSDGKELIGGIESKCRDALREAIAVNAATGVQPDWQGVGKAIREIVMDMLEEASKSGEYAFATKTAAVKAKNLEAYRRDRLNRKIWKQQQRELADWRAGRTKEPAWRLAARQQTTRMRTGWNRWYNQGQIKRAQESPEVAYLMFTLGNSANHTEICLSRAGMLIAKSSPKLQSHRPPLHWGCKSKLVPVTRQVAKSNGWKQSIPSGLTGDAKPDPGFMVGAVRQKGSGA